MKWKSAVASLATTVALLSLNFPVQAQSRNVASLGEMPCQSLTGNESGRYRTMNADIPVGLQMYRAVGILSLNQWTAFASRYTPTVVCRLAQAGERPQYRTLTLSFALADNNRYTDGARVRLLVYRDGERPEYRDVSRGDAIRWPIDVTGVRSVALKLECLRGSSSRSSSCPGLYFFEDIVE